MKNCTDNCECNKFENTDLEEVTEKRECNENSKRNEMMMKIRELNFAVIELSLYLDTHIDDKKALCLYNHYTHELKDLMDKYQKAYGPLTINYPCNKWRWLEEPWPWERGNY